MSWYTMGGTKPEFKGRDGASSLSGPRGSETEDVSCPSASEEFGMFCVSASKRFSSS